MPQDIGEAERKCQEIKQKRNRLFILFSRNPARVELAVEIKKMDDMIAEHTETLWSQS